MEPVAAMPPEAEKDVVIFKFIAYFFLFTGAIHGLGFTVVKDFQMLYDFIFALFMAHLFYSGYTNTIDFKTLVKRLSLYYFIASGFLAYFAYNTPTFFNIISVVIFISAAFWLRMLQEDEEQMKRWEQKLDIWSAKWRRKE